MCDGSVVMGRGDAVRPFASTVVVVVCSLVVALPAQAASTLNVPSQYVTIQQAIDAATDGDTILVAPGTYVERIDFGTKDVTVASTGGAGVTVLDGSALGTVVVMNAQAGESPTLRGFTVRNGLAGPSSAYSGGGVKTSGGPAVIEDNVITGNATCDGGGGIDARSSEAVIRRNTISDNFQSGCSGGVGGGGVSIVGGGHVQLVDNVIQGNSHGAHGGAVTLFSAGFPTIARNRIEGNSGGQQGGGLWIVNESDAQIENNLILGNFASQGGGVYWSIPLSRGPALVNNTIVGNLGSLGSALFAGGFDASARVANNILSGAGGSVVECDSGYDSSPPVVEFNDVLHTGAGQRYGGICGDMTGINGNLSVDPVFVDPPGQDYHLSGASPLIDSGTNSGVPARDLDGEVRTVDGDGDGVPETDIGADEAFSFVDPIQEALELIAALRAQVAMLPDEKLGKSLDAKLRDAAAAVSAGQKTRACSKLAAFISEVQVHAGGKIPSATATAWIADATRIRAVIGC
jgi:hypothetical protein